jgi:hypothetical protein
MDRPCKTYCCEYFHDGAWWGINITAYDWADAEVRAKKLSLQLKGEHYATIPANIPGAGLFVRCAVWFKNLGGF